MQSSTSRNMDQYCHRGNRSVHTRLSKKSHDEPTPWAHNSKAATGGLNSKDELRPSQSVHQFSNSLPHLRSLRSNTAKTSERKTQKEKKQQHCRDYERGTPRKSSRARRNLANVTCLNCDKKGHFADKCPKPREDRGTSEDQWLSRPHLRQWFFCSLMEDYTCGLEGQECLVAEWRDDSWWMILDPG